LKTSLEQQTTDLSSDMRKQGQDLRAEMTAAADALEDAKADRHDWGDLLVEMGTRPEQQTDVADLLASWRHCQKSSHRGRHSPGT
jgi:hypothetical protein